MSFPKLNKDFKILLILFAGLILAASCETKEPGCYQPTTVSMVCGFQQRDTNIIVDTVSLNPLVFITDTQIVYRDTPLIAPQMNVLYENIKLTSQGNKNATQLSIAFNKDKDSITYTFRADTASAVYDTITFFYTSSLHFISNNCGYNYYFNIQNVKHTTNMLDSFAYVDRNVTDANKRNVQFYFKKRF